MRRTSICCGIVLVVSISLTGRPIQGQSFVNWETAHVNPMALTPSGNLLLAVNTADNRLEVFDLSGDSPAPVRSIPVGLDPVSVRARTESEAWVVNQVSDSISIVDLPTGRVMRTIATGDEPADVVFAGSPQRAFVSVSQLNQVRVFNPSNLAAAPVIIAIQGEDPRALAVSADGSEVYAAIFGSGNRSTIIARPVVSQPGGPYGGQNPPPNSTTQFFPAIAAGLPAAPAVSHIVKQNPSGAWLDDNNRNWSNQVTWGLHDHDVAIIDTAALTVTYVSGLMNMVAGLAVRPSGEVTAVGTEALNEIRFESNVNAIFVRCELASFDPSAPAQVAIADLNPHLDYQSTSVPQATRELSIGDPRAMLWDPAGARGYVAGMGSNNVIEIDSGGKRLSQIEVGQGPSGLAINADGSRLYALNKFDGSISVIDTVKVSEIDRVSFFDPTPAVIKAGRPFLYDTHLTSGLGQASCASCHIDGRTDHLAWDLGDPAGEMIDFDQDCQAPVGGCIDWHPMKGPMVTQTLQGIIGNEPFHWRGEKNDLSEFNVAYTALQGRDSELTPAQMQQLIDFVDTIAYPPNPNRNFNGTLPNSLPVGNGTGNPQNGFNLYMNVPLLVGNFTCVACHALPGGSNNLVDIPGVDPQNRKTAQLRNMHEKTGFNRASQQSNRGFGFNHDGTADTLFALLSAPGFQFPPGPPGAQQRRDIEAYMLAFSTDTHPATGRQATVLDGSAIPAAQQTLINDMINLAGASAVGLIAKRVQNGLERGYAYVGNGTFQSDRAGETINSASLLSSAATGSEITFTVVPNGSQTRIGVDRDSDGSFDRDELDACSGPADDSITPLNVCIADIAPDNGDGSVNVDDLILVIGQWGAAGGPADIAPGCGDGTVSVDDLLAVINAWGACP